MHIIFRFQRHTNYTDNINPPILHRKESFIPVKHPRRAEFEALTREEETAGLYEESDDDWVQAELGKAAREKGAAHSWAQP